MFLHEELFGTCTESGWVDVLGTKHDSEALDDRTNINSTQVQLAYVNRTSGLVTNDFHMTCVNINTTEFQQSCLLIYQWSSSGYPERVLNSSIRANTHQLKIREGIDRKGAKPKKALGTRFPPTSNHAEIELYSGSRLPPLVEWLAVIRTEGTPS